MRKQTVVNATKILFKEGPVKFIKHTVYHINYMNKKKNNGSNNRLGYDNKI